LGCLGYATSAIECLGRLGYATSAIECSDYATSAIEYSVVRFTPLSKFFSYIMAAC
jgi:hypothetical protein